MLKIRNLNKKDISACVKIVLETEASSAEKKQKKLWSIL